MTKMAHANHLINETSPYLLQHAFNPVEWYPWGPEALAQARKLNKPILLSIGYSACHWCHVMAHESFEDSETAALMNNLFINIKVDREERPDLDKIYQTAHYLLTQQNGGWPLTIFLTPDDLTPFFSGTYFPPETNYQLPAFKQVLKGLANFYQQKPEDIKQQNAQLRELLIKEEPIINDVHLNNQPIVHAIRTLQNTFDKNYGGFNGAPKFPQAPKLEFLLLNDSPIALQTLLKMAEGGIYDQIGGGFYRYAVDQAWQIPHFEKMLYDNAQLLHLYSLAAYHFNQPYFAHIALETAQWISTQMQDTNGGYYSSLDADSEGHEGKFYVWDKEIEQHLFPEEYALIRLYYGLNKAPNFEGHWHLTITESLATVADQLALPVATAEKLLVSAKAKLVKVRAEREMPCLDDKILTGWNGLMIKGMISAGSLLKEPQFIRGAERALNFIRQTLWKNNRLFATCRGGQVHLAAYLDDYVFLIDALLHYLQYRWDSELLSFATELMNSVLTHFMDEKGGFYFTANDHEKILYRPKSMMDEAIPSGNGIAVRCLFLLGHLLGETRYLRAAEKTLHAAWSSLTFSPTEYCTLLIGLEEYLVPPQMIVIRASLPEIKVWQENCASLKNYVFAIPHTETNLPGLLANMQGSEQPCAYICEGTHCSAVISDLQELKQKVK